jgi:glycosyltransferase involved in cell wall biosynthesis
VRLAFVVQRYGPDIAGGSEMHCRQLAERLSTRHDITVLTTCARDYVTWANAYPPGTSTENGLRVHRFPVVRTRNLKAFADLSDEVFDDVGSTPEREVDWFRANGPDAPALLEHLRVHGGEYDLVLFWAFRYAPTFFGLPSVAERAILLPTAEEDPAVDLASLQEFFAKPAGYLFLTPEEETLVSTRAGRALRPSRVIGMGLDAERDLHPPRAVLDHLGIPEEFVLYLGRVDRNKGCATLLEYFQEFVECGGTTTTLVLAGPSTLTIPNHPRIRALGYVADAVRRALLSHARVLMVPSPYESLSIVLLEAWNHATPALVNADCKVLRGQVRRASGGLYYRSSRDFQETLHWLLANDAGRKQLGEQGLAYVNREYRWTTVLERVESLLEEVSRRRPAASA